MRYKKKTLWMPCVSWSEHPAVFAGKESAAASAAALGKHVNLNSLLTSCKFQLQHLLLVLFCCNTYLRAHAAAKTQHASQNKVQHQIFCGAT